MADLRLDRRQDEGGAATTDRRLGRAALHARQQGCRQRADLNRVAQGGPGPMHLKQTDVGRAEAGRCQGRPHYLLLRRAVGRREAAAAAILVDGAAGQEGEGGSGLRGFESRGGDEKHHPGRLCAHVAVCRGVQGLAAAVGRQHPW
jgi:hypothetical protein